MTRANVVPLTGARMKSINDQLKDKVIQCIVLRAIEEGCSLYSCDNVPIDTEFARDIDALTGQFCDLIDDYKDACEVGDFEASKDALKNLCSSPQLRLITAYHLKIKVPKTV